MRFRDRVDAGQQLAQELRRRDLVDPVVLALPRGGVPVGYELARALGAPLDVFVARKIGAPGQPEFGIGAISEGGGIVANSRALHALGLSGAEFDRLVDAERRELERRVDHYRGNRPLPSLEGRDVVLVDDGLATGVTAEAALHAIRRRQPHRLLLAVPACSPQTASRLREIADDVVCVIAPQQFAAVGQWYDRFDQTSDDEVVELLRRATAANHPAASPTGGPVSQRGVTIVADGVRLHGDLAVPQNARGMVLFAHGSGSSRHSRRNRTVAAALQRRGLGTLLLDLLTSDEEVVDERTRHLRFDIELLAGRLAGAAAWMETQPETLGRPFGYFGASTGAGAALVAAARRPAGVAAVVSRGGRPDLAGAALADVKAPTLLIVGERDEVVIQLNRQAMRAMRTDCRLEIVPGATHLFEEPGTLEVAARVAGDWFCRHCDEYESRASIGSVRSASGGP